MTKREIIMEIADCIGFLLCMATLLMAYHFMPSDYRAHNDRIIVEAR